MDEKIVKDSQGLAKDLVNDYISRQAAIERATKDHDFYKGATTPADMARRDELLNVMCWLGELPSAQPEIIRCRECKYNDMPPTAGNAGCTLLYGMTNQNGFCSLAERREVSE